MALKPYWAFGFLHLVISTTLATLRNVWLSHVLNPRGVNLIIGSGV